jgi:hypothetical protein
MDVIAALPWLAELLETAFSTLHHHDTGSGLMSQNVCGGKEPLLPWETAQIVSGFSL